MWLRHVGGRDFPFAQHWRYLMNNRSNTSHPNPSRGMKPRRLALLASAAGLSMAVLAAGPSGYLPFNLPAFASSAHAAEAAQNTAGFADLVTKVKPAVISVRVKIDGDSDNTAVSQRDDEGMNPGQSDSPFNEFSKQFGFRGHNGMPQRHQVITGEGSGFFISADGYAVTNNHVVDHAKSVQVTTDDGTVYTAKVIGTDKKTDLALIKVDGKKDFTFVKFSDAQPRVGDIARCFQGDRLGLLPVILQGLFRSLQLGIQVRDFAGQESIRLEADLTMCREGKIFVFRDQDIGQRAGDLRIHGIRLDADQPCAAHQSDGNAVG